MEYYGVYIYLCDSDNGILQSVYGLSLRSPPRSEEFGLFSHVKVSCNLKWLIKLY